MEKDPTDQLTEQQLEYQVQRTTQQGRAGGW